MPLRRGLVAGITLVAGLAHRLVNLLQLTLERFGQLQRRRQVVNATVKHTVMKQLGTSLEEGCTDNDLIIVVWPGL